MSASAQTPMLLKQIVDGFSYNTSLQWLPLRWFPQALAQMDILRRAAQYRSRDWVIPQDQDEPIQPFDTLYYQIEVAGGSYLWGYSFASLSALGPNPDDPTGPLIPAETAASDLLIEVVDSCTGIPLFQDFVNANSAHATAIRIATRSS